MGDILGLIIIIINHDKRNAEETQIPNNKYADLIERMTFILGN